MSKRELRPGIALLTGDALSVLRTLPDASVNCILTSPPYFAQRDYGVAGQLGLETTLDTYITALVQVFREARRVLREDGTCWVVIGDSYKDKQLLLVPARLALALQADDWRLRSDIIWHKPNPMPEPVTDRPTRAHEHVFLLTKAARYFYDADAVREAAVRSPMPMQASPEAAAAKSTGPMSRGKGINHQFADRTRLWAANGGRNLRDVWSIVPEPFPGAHVAVFPPALVELCIKAGCPPGGVVLDPFVGSGTTLMVAGRLQRNAIGIELNQFYVEVAVTRLMADAAKP